jgi:hypothetical protein
LLCLQPKPGESQAVKEGGDIMARSLLLSTEPKGRALEAEEMLMMAVLEQAVADLDHSCPAVRADADAYVFSYGSDYSIFSFDSVCHYFKLSPAAVREALRARGGRRMSRKDAAELFRSAA